MLLVESKGRMGSPAQLRERAYHLYQTGNSVAAEDICRQLLAEDPRHAEAVYLLAVIALDAGQQDESYARFSEAARIAPDNHVFVNALGEAHQTRGLKADAIGCFRQAIASRPSYERAHNNLGLMLHEQGKFAAAAACFAEAVRLNPRYAIAHNNLGAALQAEGRFDEALANFGRALQVRPDYAEAHFNTGSALQSQGDPVGAAASFQEATRIRPSYAKAHFHLGQVFALCRRDYESLAAYETAVRLEPDNTEMLLRMVDVLVLKKDWPAVIGALERAYQLKPDDPGAFASLFQGRQLVCDWQSYHTGLERLWADTEARLNALARSWEGEAPGEPRRDAARMEPRPPEITQSRPRSKESPAVSPFQALTLPWSMPRLLAVARGYSDSWVLQNRNQKLSLNAAHPTAIAPGGRLKIGYLSGDYCDHPISHLLHGFFGRHDRDRFEVFAYSFGPIDDSPYRRRISAECEHFVDVASLSYPGISRRIAADGVHILVDLMGHTGVNRLGAIAMRPAPIQVSFLGMLGTMGADFIDYLITDSIVTPPEFAREFTEQFVTLPHSYLIAEPEPAVQGATVTRRALGLPDDGFVYCSFNSAYKIEPGTFDVWMRILSQVPASVLWLCSPGAVIEKNLRSEARARGVEPDRLVFSSFAQRPEHVRRHQAADLFLDTLIYNAAATSSLSLQAGLPVLTCLGDKFASRVGASLLTTIGLPELIARDRADYERIAIELARNPEHLGRLRARLSATIKTSPLFDTPRFCPQPGIFLFANVGKSCRRLCTAAHQSHR